MTAATYLLPQNQHLAAAYLRATAGYIALYSDLFGPYPFQKFAVVENFFPTGFGFPSYTLMGGTVLRLPFIIRTSLGHEIAHAIAEHGGERMSHQLALQMGGNWLTFERVGETAPPHRHSGNALRFVMEGNGAETIVNGKTCVMNERDLILTPLWSWHAHQHHASDRIVCLCRSRATSLRVVSR